MYLFFVPVLMALVCQYPIFANTGIFFAVPIVLHTISNCKIRFSELNKAISFVIKTALIVNTIQVYLFWYFGRLPALAYYGSISVRFGSFLDAPNEFGIMLPWFFAFSCQYYQGKERLIILGGLFLSLLLTQSMTAIATFVIVILLVFLPFYFGKFYKYRIGTFLSILFLSLLALTFYDDAYSFLQTFMELKVDSVDVHLGGVELLYEMDFFNIFGFQPMNTWSELFYVGVLVNFGFIYLCLYVLVLCWFIGLAFVRCAKSQDRHKQIFYFGVGCYLLSLLIGNINLPYSASYPLNLLQALFYGFMSNDLLPEK
jgi:hypothetical protein